jgi:hypothetical protein
MDFLILIVSIISVLITLWAIDKVWQQRVEFFIYYLGAKKVISGPRYQFVQIWQNFNFNKLLKPSDCYTFRNIDDVVAHISLFKKTFLLVSENVLDKKNISDTDFLNSKKITISTSMIAILVLLKPMDMIQGWIATSHDMPSWLKRGILAVVLFAYAPLILVTSWFIPSNSTIYTIIRSPSWWLERLSLSFKKENSILYQCIESIILC